MEDDFDKLLDRIEPTRKIRECYDKQLDLLKDYANYGAKLIARSFDQSGKKIADIVIITVLLKKIVCMIDAIQILLEQANINASFIPLRTLYETQLYLHWILYQDTDMRAKQYYVYYLINTKKYNEKVLNNKFDTFFSVTEMQKQEIEVQNNKINEILNSSFNDIINSDQAKKKIYKWYNLSGLNSIRDLAKELDKELEYDVLYGYFSKFAHSDELDNLIHFKEGRVIVSNIRGIKNFPFVLQNTSNFVLRTYRDITHKYLPSEDIELSKKFNNEWNTRLKNIPEIKTHYIEQ